MFCLIKGRVISVTIGLFFQEITFITEFPDSNLLLPTFLAGSKWDFPVANLLLATVNFEPWIRSDLVSFPAIHENSFIVFIVCSQVYMLLSCCLIRWTHKAGYINVTDAVSVKIPYFIDYKTEFFLPKQSKNLDPSYKMDLDLWDYLGKVKLVLYQNFKGLV